MANSIQKDQGGNTKRNFRASNEPIENKEGRYLRRRGNSTEIRNINQQPKYGIFSLIIKFIEICVQGDKRIFICL